jgi:hypothetical protein
MAYAFVQTSPETTGSGTTIVSPSMTFTTGNLIVVPIIVGNSTEQHVSSVTDTLGNTYHLAGGTHVFSSALFSGAALEIWYAQNITGGTGTITVSWPSAGGFSIAYFMEYSGLALTNSLQGTANASGISTTGSVTASTTAQPAMFFEFTFGGNGSSAATATNVTDRSGNFVGGNGSVGDTRLTSLSPFTATTTFNNGVPWIAGAACFIEFGVVPPASSGIVVVIME